MKYFFVLGNNPTLSVMEIYTILKNYNKINGYYLTDSCLVLDLEESLNPKMLIKILGGTIKIGIIHSEIKNNFKEILKNSVNIIDTKNIFNKFNFGFSYYGKNKINTRAVGMEIKKYLKEKNISCRWVVSREKNLSSVVVKTNKLIDGGIEIVLIQKDNKILIGKTLEVQHFKELSFRDYGRPARDDLSGMLPPKLAQIMINLSEAKKNSIIFDPFCGSGTILTEAMLMGYNNLIGSDISIKAINDTKKNIDWILKNYKLKILNLKLINTDAQFISKKIEGYSIDTIITEPYLGPQRGNFNIKKTLNELENLYEKCLFEFKKILKSDGKIVMIWPIFKMGNKNFFINPKINNYKIYCPLPLEVKKNKLIKLTEKNTIVYGREGQKVFREIIILSNN